jgi:hypothetical protein
MSMPNMNWGNGAGNGSNWGMPNMGGGKGTNWSMPNMGNGNGTAMSMPNWGNGGNGSNWKMPNMNWGNNNNPYNRGTAMTMPNWGNNAGGWNRPPMGYAPMYMAVPYSSQVPMMRPPQPRRMIVPAQQMVSPYQTDGGAQQAPSTQQTATPTPEKQPSAADIVQQKVEEMQRLNQVILQKLMGEDQQKEKKTEAQDKVEAKAEAPVVAQQQAAEAASEKKPSATDFVKQKVQEMQQMNEAISNKLSSGSEDKAKLEAVKVETKVDAPVVAEQKAADKPAETAEKEPSATDVVKQKIQEMKDLTTDIAKKVIGGDKEEVKAEAEVPAVAK